MRKKNKKFKMTGGFTPEENEELNVLGFTPEHIQILENTGIGLHIIKIAINQTNPDTNAKFTPQELIDSINGANEEIENIDENEAVNNEDQAQDGIEEDQNDMMNQNQDGIEEDQNDIMNQNQDGIAQNQDGIAQDQVFIEQGPGLEMADFEPDSPRSVTELGGRKTKRRRKTAKKRRKTMKNKKTMKKSKNRKTEKKRKTKRRKQRGGNCYGNGVGANAYDPNYSIYNTNQLQMFPYRPN